MRPLAAEPGGGGRDASAAREGADAPASEVGGRGAESPPLPALIVHERDVRSTPDGSLRTIGVVSWIDAVSVCDPGGIADAGATRVGPVATLAPSKNHVTLGLCVASAGTLI